MKKRQNRQSAEDFRNRASEFVKDYDFKVVKMVYESVKDNFLWTDRQPGVPELNKLVTKSLLKNKIVVIHQKQLVEEITIYLSESLGLFYLARNSEMA